MTSDSNYHLKSTDFFRGEALCADISTAVLIIGAGVTGLSAACMFARAGVDTLLVEAGEVGLRTVGRSAGMLTSIPEVDFIDFSPEERDAVLSLSISGIENLLYCIEEHELACQLNKFEGSLYLGCNTTQRRHLEEELQLRENANVKGQVLLGHDELQSWFPTSLFTSALFDPQTHSVNPLALSHEMARLFEAHGGKVCTNTEIVNLDCDKKMAITRSGQVIKFEYAILAQGISAYSFSILRDLKNVIIPLNSHILVTPQIPEEDLRRLFPGDLRPQLWDSKQFFNYVRVTRDNSILFGGGEVVLKDPRQSPGRRQAVLEQLRNDFKLYFPDIPFEVAHFWGGVLPVPLDHLPFVGEVARDIYLGAYMPGINFAYECGARLAQQILQGRAFEQALFERIRWDRSISLPQWFMQQCASSPLMNPVVNQVIRFSDRRKMRS